MLDSQPIPRPARHPVLELLFLAAPTVAQMASYTFMQFVDTKMLAAVSDTAATAAGNSGMFAFAVISLGMGILFMVNALVSQHYGHRDFAACGRYLWQGIWISLFFGLLLLPFMPLAGPMFDAFKHEPALVAYETTYFRITVAASAIKLIATAGAQFLLAINRPSAVLVSAIIGVSVNTLGDWLLIFGNAGFPQMGVAGAAWATNIGVTVELLVLLGFILHPAVRRTFNVLDYRPRRREMGTLLRLGIPSGFQIVAEVAAWSLFGVIVIAQFGTVAMAANQYMLRYLILGFMPCFGIASAVTALVGRYIGMGRPDLAARRAHLGFTAAAIYTVACGLVFYFARRRLMLEFTSDPEVLAIGMSLLTIAAFYSFFDAMYIVYCGALRGASDTFIPALATALLVWSIMLVGGYSTARLFPHLGAVGPWLMATVYGIALGVFMLTRFQLGRWRMMHVETEPQRK